VDWHLVMTGRPSDLVTTYMRVWKTLRESAAFGADAQRVISSARQAL
jgi:hypothetical protein